MRPIANWTIWQRRMSLFWWLAGIIALIALTLAIYPSFRDQAQQLDQSFSNLNDTVKSLITDTNDFLSPVGYLSSQLYYLTLPIMLSILAIGLGSSLVAKEEDNGTLELLLSRPVSRGRLLAAKAWAGFVIIMSVGLAALVTTAIGSELANMNVALSHIILASFMCLLLVLLFGAISFTLSTIGRARGASIGIAVVIAFGGYIISSLASNVDWLRWPAKAFPYHYYEPSQILNGSFRWQNATGFVAVIMLLGIISWNAFRRRDLNG